MAAIYALAILLGIFALGEIIAKKTKAMISTVLVIVIALLIGFWFGLPEGIINYSQLSAIGMPMVMVLIVGIGSTIDFKLFVSLWKTVLISLIATILGVATIMVIGQFVVGRYMAFSAAPIFAGTNVATILMIDSLTQNGMLYLIPFILLVFVFDNLIGIPLASWILKKDARLFLADKAKVARYNRTLIVETTQKRLIKIPEAFKTPSGVFFRLVIVGALSFYLASLTDGRIHFLVVCLVMGILATELGFIERHSLPKTGASSFVILASTVVIFGSLAQTTPAMMLDMIVPILIIMPLGFIGNAIGGYFSAKALKISPYMGIAMGLTCSFGMPTTFLIPKEIAATMGSNEEEKVAIEQYMTPHMVTAGFVSVTIASVFIAQFVVILLFG